MLISLLIVQVIILALTLFNSIFILKNMRDKKNINEKMTEDSVKQLSEDKGEEKDSDTDAEQDLINSIAYKFQQHWLNLDDK